MQVCLTSGLLGSLKHLVVDDDRTSWSDDVPRGAWVLDRGGRWPDRDIAVLARLAGVELTFPDGPSVRALRSLGLDVGHVPWTSVLPGWKLRQMTCGLLEDVRSVLNGPDASYYGLVFEPSRHLLSSLGRAKVDVARLQEHAERGDGNVVALKSFTPDPDGLARRVNYELFGGRTGRLTIESGPQILTLKRSHRDVVTSRFEGGRIVLMDYASLEARIAAIEAGHEPPEDIYAELAESVLGGASRKIAKLAVLSTMFGAGRGMLEDHVEPGTAEWLADRLRRHFKVARYQTKLKFDWTSNGGFVRSKYGRRVPCDARAHILYNSYIQSTGVDVSLKGFMAVVEEIRSLAMRSTPIFVLHDALIVDFHPEELVYIERLCEVGSHIEGYEHPFPIRAKELTE